MNSEYSLFFIRHGKLNLSYKNHSEMPFEILADLGFKKIDPQINKKDTLPLIKEVAQIIPLKKLERIYTSPSKRCIETAKLIIEFINTKISIETALELREVHFDLNSLFPQKERGNINLKDINNKVLLSIAKNENGVESFIDIYKRINSFIKKIRKSELILFITHDFLMRIIETYIINQGNQKISAAYNDLKNTHRNDYIHGFATNKELSNIIYF